MEIGEPQRTIYVEPIELPEPLRPQAEPEPNRVDKPAEEPVSDGV